MSGVSSEDGYLELLKRSLTGALQQDAYTVVRRRRRLLDDESLHRLEREEVELAKRVTGELRRELEIEGKGEWPLVATTMVGMKRLENVQVCVQDVIEQGVRGDLIETGVWRGGTVILMRALLRAHGDEDRSVWVADSFEGLPPPDPDRYPEDEGSVHHLHRELAVSADEVRANFRRYGLLDQRVRFLEGWFRDTLPGLEDRRWAVIRLDGDMYESTMEALVHLYPRLSVGGYLIVDDYALPRCRRAVDDFRADAGITEPIERIDWTGVYWRRQAE